MSAQRRSVLTLTMVLAGLTAFRPAAFAGGFATVKTFNVGTDPQSVAVGDFNGDGHPDMAVANFSTNNVSVLLGNGDGTFRAAVNYATGHSPLSVAVGDFNGDGRLDLVVA